MTKDFHGTVVQRLLDSGSTPAQVALALMLLQQIRWYSIGPELDVCSKTAGEIGEELRLTDKRIPAVMSLLEQVGAIHRVADGREKVICLSREYVHAELMRREIQQTAWPFEKDFGHEKFVAKVKTERGFWRQFKRDFAEPLVYAVSDALGYKHAEPYIRKTRKKLRPDNVADDPAKA